MTGSSFADAATATLSCAHDMAPLDLWLVTTVQDADQFVVASQGVWSRDLAAGSVMPWLDSLCLHMAAGRAPALAPRVADVPLYAAAATGRWRRVRGYAGVPLLGDDGELLGTLCGFSGREEVAAICAAGAMVQPLGRLLSATISAQRAAAEAEARLAAMRRLAEADALTTVRNRRGWQADLGREDERCARYGASAGVLVLDLDELKSVNDLRGHAAGDRLLCAAAEILRYVCRPTDVVARTGGDEFAVLAVEVDETAMHALVARLRHGLAAAGVAASVGAATREPHETLIDTWIRADRAMYVEKQRRSRGASAVDRAAGGAGSAEFGQLRGITLAPTVARLVAAEVVHGVGMEDLEGVRPHRFGTDGQR